MYRLIADANLCSGCRICELVCSFHHYQEFNPSLGRIRIEINRGIKPDTRTDQIDVPHVCQQCSPALCAEACSVEAIYWDPQYQLLRIDKELCIGCGLCEEHCPHDMIRMVNDGQLAQKCDMCLGEPQCVSFCPRDALQLDK